MTKKKKKKCEHEVGMMRCLVNHVDSGQCGRCVKCRSWILSKEIHKYKQVNRI